VANISRNQAIIGRHHLVADNYQLNGRWPDVLVLASTFHKWVFSHQSQPLTPMGSVDRSEDLQKEGYTIFLWNSPLGKELKKKMVPCFSLENCFHVEEIAFTQQSLHFICRQTLLSWITGMSSCSLLHTVPQEPSWFTSLPWPTGSSALNAQYILKLDQRYGTSFRKNHMYNLIKYL
jgi:hypothetical protein